MASESGAFLALPAQSLSPPGPRSPQAPPPATSPKVNIKPTLATAGPGPSGSNVRTRLLYHVPGVITSIAIDVGALMAASNGGFVELSFRDAVEEVVPRAKGAGKDSVLLSPQRITTISSTPAAPALGSSSVPSIADRFAPPRRNPRYANIIEQLEKKYGGRSSMRSEEAEEEEVEEEEVEEDDKEGEDSSGEGERDGEDEGDDEREGKNASAPGAGEGAAADANGAASGDNGGAPTRNKKKRRRRGENADYYDSDDSFIDDEEIIEKIEVSYRMKAVKTKHSGFFVSSGALETLNPSGGFGLEYSQEGSDGKAAPRKRARVEGGAKKRPAAAATKPPSAASKSAFAAFQIYTEAKGLKFTPRLYKELRVADEVISKNGDSEWFITSLVKLFTPENISRKVLEHKLEKLRARSSGEPEPRNSSLIQAINEASNALLSAVRPMLMTKIASLSSSNSLSSGPTRAELFDLWADLWKDESLLTLFDVMRAKCEEHARVETVKREAAKAAKLERERLEQEQDKSSSNTSAAADANEAGATGAQGSSSSNVTTKPQEAESQPIEERMRHMMLCEISRQLRKICEAATEILFALMPSNSEPVTPDAPSAEGRAPPNDKASFSNELLKIAKKARQAPGSSGKAESASSSVVMSPKKPIRASLPPEQLVIPVPISAGAAMAAALLTVPQKKKPKKSLDGGAALKITPASSPAASTDAIAPLSPAVATETVVVPDDGAPPMGSVFDDPPEFDPRDFMISINGGGVINADK